MLNRLAGVASEPLSTTKNISTLVAARVPSRMLGVMFLLTVTLGMQVSLSRLTDKNMKRVYELAQRTNQMNFSGNRYSIEELQRIAADSRLDTYVIQCRDRFGSYGIVGFSVVDRDEPRLLDLMFSCRVQAKCVEHGFLGWLLNQHRAKGQRDFFANYRKTPKNEPSGAVFQEVGFDEVGVKDGVTTLRFARNRDIPEESVVEIIVEGST